jgi:hypothetical protein
VVVVEDLDDVREAQTSDALGLALETLDELGHLHHQRLKHLDRHIPIQAGLEPLVDVCHPAALEAGDDLDNDPGWAGEIGHVPP